ncbi:MAG: hypothetical protein ABGX83_06010 [Nitrospira sp.]|nr:hypothetical protein [Candidatus Manganitrophaceae bacterium]HIL33979.1 hypothetical protein [Candidatus Manganitrophaceae bacterium]
MKKIIAFFMGFFLLTGCATIFSDGKDVITFDSNVDKTKVFFDNSLMGETPLTLSVDRKLQKIQLRFSKEGYQSQEMRLAHKFNLNAGVILDITGTATSLTPGAIDVLSGNLIKYSPTEYHIEMVQNISGDLNLFRNRLASMRYTAHNFLSIRRELLAGNGDFLDSLHASFRIPLRQKEMFDEILQKNLKMLVTSDNGLEFWNRLNQLIKDHPTLKNYEL